MPKPQKQYRSHVPSATGTETSRKNVKSEVLGEVLDGPLRRSLQMFQIGMHRISGRPDNPAFFDIRYPAGYQIVCRISGKTGYRISG
jgi:hypothetical protein